MAITGNSNSEKIYLPCPVTGGVSTRMTQQSFVVACGAKRSRRTTNCWGHDVAKEVFPRRCDWCKGKIECWPDELVLADVVTTIKMKDNKNMSTAAGCVCDICGSPANSKKNKNRGMTLCSSCMGIVPCVDRLDAVVAMMQRTGKTEELLNKLRPHDDLEAVVRDARETLVKALPSGEALDDAQSLYDIATIAEEVARYIQEQQEKIARLNTDDKAYQLEMENHRLKRENEYLEQRKRQEPLDSALLEWARRQYEAGGVRLKITVEAADENN